MVRRPSNFFAAVRMSSFPYMSPTMLHILYWTSRGSVSISAYMALRDSEVRDLERGDRHVLAHLGIPDAVRLSIMDSSYWYYDAGSRTLHEWMCWCRACTVTFRQDVPSHHCKFRPRYTVHDSWTGVDESDLRI